MTAKMQRKTRNKKRGLLIAEHGSRCAICGKRGFMTLDHIVPRAKGGTNDLDNLQLLCRPCNEEKADSLPVCAVAA